MEKELLEQIQERVDEDEEQQDLFAAYDDMDNMRWEPPEGWRKKDWMRIRISSEAHDALKQTANIFDTHNPKWNVMPRSEADADAAEELETWLEYHATKANMIGEVAPFRKAMHNSAKFNRVIMHVDYLPYWLPKDKNKWSKEQKFNSVNGPFCFESLDPRNVYYEMGKYGLRWVAVVANVDGQELINKWKIYENDSEEGKQIKNGLAKLKSKMEDDDEIDFISVDCTSFDKRFCIAIPTQKDNIDDLKEFDFDTGDYIVILDGENKLDFIPYAVATGDSDALLHSAHVGKFWENQNITDTVLDSSKLRMAFIPPIIHTSTIGDKDLDVNWNGDIDSFENRQGESTQVTNLPAIDPALMQLSQINSQRLAKSVGIQNVGMQDIAGNVQFSTVQAQIQLQLTALQPYKRTTEKALSQVAILMLRWIKKAETTEYGYRTKNRVKKEGQYVGEMITVAADELEPDDLIIQCNLLSNSPTDKQSQINMYTTLKQAGAEISWGELLEDIGLGNPAQLRQAFLDEQLSSLALKQFADEQALMLQLKGQEATMQMQMQQQQAQMQAQQAAQQPSPEEQQAMAQAGGANPSQQDPNMPQGDMNNPGAGGQPPMMGAPGMTRNNVRGAG